MQHVLKKILLRSCILLTGSYPQIIRATKENRDDAIRWCNGLQANGGTNIQEALLLGIQLAEVAVKQELLEPGTQPMVCSLPCSTVTY